MNGNRQMARELVSAISAEADSAAGCDIVVLPPYVLIPEVAPILSDTQVAFGGQNISIHPKGAYTGEISGAMLVEWGCRYVTVGHSERRTLYGEGNELVARKAAAAMEVGLTPIVCLGETQQERDRGETEQVVGEQLDALLQEISIDQVVQTVIAYEPVWAIGTGLTASPEQAESVHAFIRARVSDKSEEVAQALRILYGGSVKPDNAESLFGQPNIDGGLIGGASLEKDDFLQICRAASG